MGKKIQRSALANAIGRQVRKLRDEVSREDLAKLSNVDERVIVKIEHKRALDVSKLELSQVIRALGVINNLRREELKKLRELARKISSPKVRRRRPPPRSYPHRRLRPIRKGAYKR